MLSRSGFGRLDFQLRKHIRSQHVIQMSDSLVGDFIKGLVIRGRSPDSIVPIIPQLRHRRSQFGEQGVPLSLKVNQGPCEVLPPKEICDSKRSCGRRRWREAHYRVQSGLLRRGGNCDSHAKLAPALRRELNRNKVIVAPGRTIFITQKIAPLRHPRNFIQIHLLEEWKLLSP